MPSKGRLTNLIRKRNVGCKAVEKITHIVRECTRLAQKEYKRRHDWIGSCIHWEICGAKGIPLATKWQEHQPEGVMQNETCKVIWDFTI